jgi:asparagine synthase (glutamine-hydrolysing)
VCGILGIVGQQVEPGKLETLARTMIHRGPDAGGVAVFRGGGFAHRRLSILDTSSAANQPFHDPRNRAILVFNGEIYNFLELRSELEQLGVRFRTNSDTEVLLHGYLHWKEGVVSRLNGMFAFAVWDVAEQKLFLARDRLGKKPLYYARLADGGLMFSSEFKALVASGLIETRIDPEAVLDYLNLNYVLAPKTLLAQVRQLQPAHTGVWQANHWHTTAYWNLLDSFLAPKITAPEEEVEEELDHLLQDATRLRLLSDVPLGSLLSGGVDSSLITAVMRGNVQSALHSFSIEFPEKDYNEGRYSRLAARHIDTQHHPRLVENPGAEELKNMARLLDCPLGDDSIVSTYLLCQRAREQVTVALSGDGADELFAGYVTYQADALHRNLGLLRRPLRWLVGAVGGWLPERGAKISRRFRARQLHRGLRLGPAAAHFSWRQVADPAAHLAYRDLFRAANDYTPADTFRKFHDAAAGADWLDRFLYVDSQTWLPDDILVKVDRASMAASLEYRSPFLDYRLVEYAARLPGTLKLRGSRKKYILRKLARRYLPAEIIDRKKAGFNSPVVFWMRSSLREAVEASLSGPALQQLGISWKGGLEDQWRDFLKGRSDYQYALWGLFTLTIWWESIISPHPVFNRHAQGTRQPQRQAG